MSESTTRKRKSRFDDDAATHPEPKKVALAVDVSAAAARAAEISKQLSQKVQYLLPTYLLLTFLLHLHTHAFILNGNIRMRTIFAYVHFSSLCKHQIASVSSALAAVNDGLGVSSAPSSSTNSIEQRNLKQPAYRALLLNAAGQEVDEQGNVIQPISNMVVKSTLAAKNALLLAGKEKEKPKKKANPYLQHWTTSSSHYSANNVGKESGSGLAAVPAASVSILPGAALQGNTGGGGAGVNIGVTVSPTGEAVESEEGLELEEEQLIAEDARLKELSRTKRARKGLQFIEEGALVRKAAELQWKEERKLVAGYASGRKNLEVRHEM